MKTASIPADKLIRLRSNLCLRTAPPVYSGKGRPRLHRDKFKLNDSTTWTPALESVELNHPQLGQLRITLWKGLHFQVSPHQPMALIRLERIDKSYSWKMPKPLWLIWVGEEMPPLSEIWELYLRRFGFDHWYRLAKQRLHWTLPKFSTPKQCERWSDLMPMITWELWLAREIVNDRSKPLAKLPEQINAWSICSGHAWSFSRNWYTCLFSPNPWKIPRLAHWTTKVASYSLSHC